MLLLGLWTDYTIVKWPVLREQSLKGVTSATACHKLLQTPWKLTNHGTKVVGVACLSVTPPYIGLRGQGVSSTARMHGGRAQGYGFTCWEGAAFALDKQAKVSAWISNSERRHAGIFTPFRWWTLTRTAVLRRFCLTVKTNLCIYMNGQSICLWGGWLTST